MLRDKILEAMNRLALHGMKSVFDEVLATGIKQRATPEKILLDLLETEIGERTAKSIRYRLGLARFPVDKDLDRFEFTASPVNEMQVRHLYDGSFLADHTNVIMVGSTGTGKTHLAIAIAKQSIRNGRKARFFNVLDLVNQLEQEKLDHTGWHLETQTNSLSVGLGSNWLAWPGSDATNAVSLPIDPSNPAVFLRLTFP